MGVICPNCGSHDYGWEECADCGYQSETRPYPDEEPGERTCACGCGASLAGLRADAVYVSEAHAKAARCRASADKARTRRPSREGVGTRLYVTAAEIRLTQEALHYLGVPDSPSYRAYTRKLDLAAKRVAP